ATERVFGARRGRGRPVPRCVAHAQHTARARVLSGDTVVALAIGGITKRGAAARLHGDPVVSVLVALLEQVRRHTSHARAAAERSRRADRRAVVVTVRHFDARDAARLGAAAAPLAVGPAGLEHLAVALLRAGLALAAVVGDAIFDAAHRARLGPRERAPVCIANHAI